MEAPERAVCCGLCLCMALAVLSSVSLVYLTAIVYMPAKRELQSGLLDRPVTCTTVHKLHTDNCDWSSCFEWCLSQPNFCTQIWAEVRRNGSDIVWKDCKFITDTVCPVSDRDLVEDLPCSVDDDCQTLNDRLFDRCGRYKNCPEQKKIFKCEQLQCVSRRETKNCKNDRECLDLTGQYQCKNGLCHNMSRVRNCTYLETGDTFNCRDKRNCIKLTGMFECSAGECTQILWPWDCRRRCTEQPVGNRSLIIISGDRTVMGDCGFAVTDKGARLEDKHRSKHRGLPTDTGAKTMGSFPQERRRRHPHVLLLSCTRLNVSVSTGEMYGFDCVNGTRISRQKLYTSMSSVQLMTAFTDDGQTMWKREAANNSSADLKTIENDDATDPENSNIIVTTENTDNIVVNENSGNIGIDNIDDIGTKVNDDIGTKSSDDVGAFNPSDKLKNKDKVKTARESVTPGTNNVSLGPANLPLDWTELRERFLLETSSRSSRLLQDEIPLSTQLNIFPISKLYINTETCVNTLIKECTEFFLDHGSDGRNYTSRDTFPCFYNPNNSAYVTVRFDVEGTKELFLISFTVPALLCVVSCSCLSISSKILRISDSGHMRLRCRRSSKPDLEDEEEVRGEEGEVLDVEIVDLIQKQMVCKRRMAVNYYTRSSSDVDS